MRDDYLRGDNRSEQHAVAMPFRDRDRLLIIGEAFAVVGDVALTVPPGVGMVFYRFRDQLQFTLVHADGTLTDSEAADFAARLRARLLDP